MITINKGLNSKSCLLCILVASITAAAPLQAQQAPGVPARYRPGFHAVFPNKTAAQAGQGSSGGLTPSLAAAAASRSRLPLWSYYRQNSRDPFSYPGFVVGVNPFNDDGNFPANASVRTYVIPLVFKIHSVGTTWIFDSSGNLIGLNTVPGDSTFDPTQPQPSCLGSVNNVPITLALQSPLFQDLPWNFGGTHLGTTQYIDAFQRAAFWNVKGLDHQNFHVRFSPVTLLDPVVLDVPADLGSTTPTFDPTVHPCAPSAMVDINFFDNWIDTVVIPSLASKGVDPNSLPIFVAGNINWSIGGLPAAAGYHSYSSLSIIQTYAVSQFGTDQYWTWPDSMVLSHELGEWTNDPNTSNPAPAWGGTGQVVGLCQDNFEVGDPLTGIFMPPTLGANGYTYTLQELAFFSWFFGGPSLGVNGWFSSNGTFLTDAGPVCH